MEEQFYLLIPILIYCLSRRYVIAVFVSAVVAAPLLRNLSSGFHAMVSMPWRADSLLLGSCLAILVRTPRFMGFVARHPPAIKLVASLVLGAELFITMQPRWQGEFHYFGLALSYALLILVVHSYPASFPSRLLKQRFFTWFGMLSYGIYVFHQAVNGIVHGFFRGSAPAIHSVGDFGITALAFAVTLLLALLSYRCFESPILKYGHRFPYANGSQTVIAAFDVPTTRPAP